MHVMIYVDCSNGQQQLSWSSLLLWSVIGVSFGGNSLRDFSLLIIIRQSWSLALPNVNRPTVFIYPAKCTVAKGFSSFADSCTLSTQPYEMKLSHLQTHRATSNNKQPNSNDSPTKYRRTDADDWVFPKNKYGYQTHFQCWCSTSTIATALSTPTPTLPTKYSPAMNLCKSPLVIFAITLLSENSERLTLMWRTELIHRKSEKLRSSFGRKISATSWQIRLVQRPRKSHEVPYKSSFSSLKWWSVVD